MKAPKRKRSEASQRRQLMLSEAEKLANIGSFEWDIRGNKVTWSEGLYHIYGLNPQQFGASFEAFLQQVHPSYRARVKKTIETSYRQGTPFQMEERIVRSDGKIRVLFSKGEVLKDDNGQPVRLIGVCQDITDRRQAERSRLKSMKLRAEKRQLQKLLRQLQETQAQLIQSEKMASLGSLVAGILHEMNSPMATVNSAVDVSSKCIRNVLGELDSRGLMNELTTSQKSFDILQGNCDLIENAMERLLAIVTSLKSFSRLDEAALQSTDLHECLESVLTLVAHQFENRIEFRRDYGQIPKILCYPGELNQAFMNILLNAGQAISAHGSITIKTFAENSNVGVEIRDTGMGISSERMKHLFQPAFSVKGARVKAGVGLFTTLNIIEKHRGRMNVDSTVGEGTKFSIVLPVALQKEKGLLHSLK